MAIIDDQPTARQTNFVACVTSHMDFASNATAIVSSPSTENVQILEI